MNKKIKELAEQAEMSTYLLAYDTDFNIAVEKFADLIVREVFSKIEDERFEVYQPVKESVMKQFGVEE